MQRQVRRRIERSEKIKAKAAAQKPIDKKWIFLTIGVLVAIVVVVTSIAAFRNFDWVVARINGTNIRISDMGHAVWAAEHMLMEEYFELFPGDFSINHDRVFRGDLTFADVLRQEAAINVAVSILLEAEAERRGAHLTTENHQEIQMNVDGWANDFSALNDMGIFTRRQLIDVLERIHIRNNVFDAMMDEFDDTQRLNMALELDVLWAAQHILIGFNPPTAVDEAANDEAANDEAVDHELKAYELARSLHARAIAGEDFEQLMLVYSDDQDPYAPPDLYTFTSGVMVPEFEQGTRALAIGEISDPIRSFLGYHIIRRAEPNPDPFTWMGDVNAALGLTEDVLFEQIYKDARERIVFTSALDRVEVGR